MAPLLKGRLSGSRAKEAAADQVAVAWLVASHLLDYPDEGLVERAPALRALLAQAPDREAELLGRFLDRLEETGLEPMQEEYVATFDTRRRCNLFLTYFAHGDTRKRGMALLRFKQEYLAAGMVLGDHELPDHLCVVLEFAGTVDFEAGRQLVLDHRAGLEVLRLALAEAESPWADVVAAVCAGLPALRGDDMEAIRALAAAGPPEEEVGMTPYGTPGFDAALTDRSSGPVDLPMPTISRRGA